MAIQKMENGKVKIGAQVLTVPETATDVRGVKAQTPSALEAVPQLFAGDFGLANKNIKAMVKTALSADDEHRRLMFLEQDKNLQEILSFVPGMVQKIRAIQDNKDWNFEAKNRQILEIVKGGVDKFRGDFGRIFDRLSTELVNIEKLCRKALEPEPWIVPGTQLTEGLSIYDDVAKVLNKQMQALVSEARAEEIRNYLGSLDKPACAKALGKYGKEANLLGLYAVATDPAGRDFVDKDFMDTCLCDAIRAQGGEFLLQELADARDLLQGMASRATLIESMFWSYAHEIGSVGKTPEVNLWAGIVADMLKESTEFLQVAA